MGDGAPDRDRLAAEGGDVVAMDKIGVSLFNQGLTDEAERWLTKAAELGSEMAMSHLGIVLMRTGDIEGAEHWLGIPAASGDANAMYYLAYILRDSDAATAEAWSRRAAEAGQLDAMHALGSLLLERGDTTEAERWFRQAAEAGSGKSMQRVASLLESRDDPGGAELWFRRAADAGDPYSMNHLGTQANTAGRLNEAKQWFTRSSDAGDQYGMYNLGTVLDAEGDLPGAEGTYLSAAEAGVSEAMDRLADLLAQKGDAAGAMGWYQRAAEAGNTHAMDSLGHQLQQRGVLDEALDWYLRAADAGSSFATDAIPPLRGRIKADGMLDSITFDTFGWERSADVSDTRQWRSPDGGQLVERYFDFPPDHDFWDAEDIRCQALEMLGFVASPTFRREDLPDAVQKYVPTELPEQISLVDVDLFKVGPAKCVQMTSRHRGRSGVHYAMSITVMFAECFWVLGIELSEGPVVGDREGAVARSVLQAGSTSALPEFDPYERRWDGMVPIEDDPLTRLRMLALQLRESITLGGNLIDLDPFLPPDE